MANTVYSASLIMTADVKQAKAQLKDLQSSLDSLMKTSHDSSPLGLTQEIAKATSDVAGLKAALQSATNTNTGKLDLSKFSKGLDAAKLDIKQVASSLQSLGPAGQQAFSQLATSIMSAEVPLKKTNQLLDNFKTTLANTVKWQISSSMVNSLVGAMQHAYGYAQDLNKSLNNIRIVTGYSTDQMSRFAKEANNAAKALSTTTTQYTDAALIYYQQGLAEKDIKARTDATIKMANVTGESAKAVSDYMTAIWNNFDNGSKSLEYYADVMTALGAATASSTDEIAAGLEKFAAVSETVGLSYEYATAALATVTAETRQSADVVGNAFKTLFSRIQGLNLGETMDDGTDLNKYSSALAKVGVDIKDTNGQIKQMDVILDELGAKWGTLSNDTQMALAQAVAGVRQYNQLISLMENWDTFKINLEVAEGAEGTLQEQADIYAESWQAAADRVEASFQDIYDSILNDKFFIKLTDFFGGLIDIIGNTIDGIGGMSGAFAALGVVITRVFGKDIGQALSSLVYDPSKAQDKAMQLREETNEELKKVYKKDNTSTGQARYQAYTAQSNVQNELLAVQARLEDQGTNLTEIEKAKAALLTQQTVELGKQLVAINEMADAEEADIARLQQRDETRYRREHSVDADTEAWYKENIEPFRANNREVGLSTYVYNDLKQASRNIANVDAKEEQKSFENLKKSIASFRAEIENSENASEGLKETLDNLITSKTKEEFNEILEDFKKDIGEATKAVDELYSNLRTIDVSEEQLNREMDDQMYMGQLEGQRIKKKTELDTQEFEAIEEMNKYEGVKPEAIDSFMALGDAISSCAFGITTLLGLIDVWNNEDMTFGEKLLATLTSIGMALPMIASGLSIQNLKTIQAIFGIKLYEEALEDAGDEALKTAGKNKILSQSTDEVGNSSLKAGAKIKGSNSSLKSWGKEFLATLKALTPLLIGLTLIAAGGAMIKLSVDGFKEADNDVENAVTNAKLLADEYQNVKNSYEDFKNTASSYEDVVNSMQEMKKGTLEYNEALMQANELAMSLIDAQNDLQYSIGSNGLISFKPGEIERAQKEQMSQMAQIQASSLAADIASSNLQGKSEKIDVARQINSVSDEGMNTVNSLGATGAGAAIGAGIGTIIGPLGTAAGALLGALVGSIAGVIASASDVVSSKAEEAAIQTIAKHVENTGDNSLFANEKVFKEKVLELGIDSSLIDALWANADAIKAYTKNEITRNKQEETKFKTAFNAANINNQDYINARNQEFIQNEAWRIAQEQEGAIRVNANSLWDGRNIDFWQEYLKTVYGEESVNNQGEGENYRIVDRGGGAVTVQTKDEQGGWTNLTDKNGLDEDVAYEQYIEAKLLEAAEKGIIEADKTFDNYAKELEKAGLKAGEDEDIIGRIVNDMAEGLDKTEIDASQIFEIDTSKMDDGKLKTYLENSINEAKKNLPDWFTEDWYNNLTEEQKQLLLDVEITEESTIEEIEQAIILAQQYADAHAVILNLETKDALKEAINNNNLEEAKNIWENATEAFKNAFGNDFENVINSILAGTYDDIVKQVGTIATDLTSITAAQYSASDTSEQVAQVEEEKTRTQNRIDDYESKDRSAGRKYDNLFTTDIVSDVVAQQRQGAPYADVDTSQERFANLLGFISDPNLESYFSQENNKELYEQLIGILSDPKNALNIDQVELANSLAQQILTNSGLDYNRYQQNESDKQKIKEYDAEIANLQNPDNEYQLQMDQNSYLNALSNQYGENAQPYIDEYRQKFAEINESDWTLEEKIEATKKAAIELEQQLKKVAKVDLADKAVDLLDELKDITKGTNEYNTKVFDLKENLEDAFGVKIDTENVEELVDNWDKLATKEEKVNALLSTVRESMASMDGYELGANFFNLNPESITQEVSTLLENIRNVLANNDIAWNCYLNGDATGLLMALSSVIPDVNQLATVITSLTGSSINLEDEGMLQALSDLLSAIQGDNIEDVQAALEYLEQNHGINFSGFHPAGFTEDVDYNEGKGGGGGGGSDKVDRDKLTDALSQTYQKKRDRLKAQYEGLDPESASKYIKEEIALLEEEQKILEEQVKTWKGLLKTKVQEFNQEYADELGFDLTLNDDGEIANLSEIYQRLIQMYDEGNTDLADKIYKKLQESAGIQASIDEAVQGMMDKEREQAELELKDITDRIDWRIKQIDYQIKRLNYYQEKLLIQAHGNKQTIEAMLEGFQYQEQEMLKLFEKGDALRQGIDELNAAKAKYPNHQQMFNEQILEYQSDLIDVNKDILELRADMEELVKEVLDLALDEIDIQNERINKYVSMLDRFQNIIDLSGRSILDQALKVEIGTTKLDTLINKMSISKQTMEGLAKATAEAQAALERRATDGDETSVSMWENQVEELERELEAAQDDFLANWEEVLQAAADIFDMRVQLIVQTLEDALSPFSNLSILEDRYTKEKQIQDQYLDDATKLYELNKLNRQLNLSIQDENDLLAKSKLRDIQQEILAYQKAGVDMSQYDLDILQKKYDLRLAEIALMEAQNSKTSMRLIRDAAGNWTYAYDSDQNAIEEAIQRVEDATYELSKATTQYIDNMSEELIAIQQDFASAIGEVDRNASDYQEQLLYLQEHYMTRYMQTLGEFRKATEEAGISIHDTQYGMMMDLYSFEDAQNKFKLNSDTAINDLIVNYKDWQKVVEQTMNVAGTSWESFGDDTGATLDSLQEHISALCDEISKLVDVLMQYVSTAIGMVEEWQSKYSKQVDSELAKNEAYINNDSLHQSNSGGKQSSGMDTLMRTDWNRVMNEIGEKGYGTDIDGNVYVNINDVAQIRDSKVGIAAQADMNDEVVIQHESDGRLFTSEEQKAAIKTTTAQIYNDVLTKYGLGGGYNYSYNGYAPRNYGTNTGTDYSGGSWNDPRSGWCSDWVTDVMHYSGVGDYVGGHAKVAITNHNPSRWNGGSILNGTIVGSYGGKYGHIGFFQDGYIYSTSQTGNMIDKMTIEDYINHYGTLYTTDEVSALAGYNAKKVYENQYGGSYNYTYNNLSTRLKASSAYKPSANLNRYGPTPMLYDTGGYTGEWGNEGRWAMLHEKELVLNKKDTPNILSAVKIARSIDDTISNLTSNTDWKLRNLLGFTDPIFDSQPIEQTVQINAEFPGVTDQYEIQEALSNLSNDASQYLNIKRNLF